MLTLDNSLFKNVTKSLDSFYPLVNLVNSRDVLLAQDLKPYFSDGIIDDILDLQHIYLESGKVRSCGNPSFVHSLRCLIWAKALGCDHLCSKVSLYHDYVEDFGKSFSTYSSLMKTVPEEITTQINFLTNKYRVLINSLDFSSGLSGIAKQLSDISSNPILEVSASHLLSSLSDITGDVKDFFLLRSYEFYLQDLVSYVDSTKDESVILAKFFDRLDNTLTELPGKFDTIVKLYDKNTLLLKTSKDYVFSSKNPLLKLLYILLYVRSMDQATALRHRYAHIASVRGDFYGRQYLKLCHALDLEGHKLASYFKVANKLFEDPIVIDFIEKEFDLIIS
ncbi:hypothetical protein JXA48_00880 [Candidatus Woesearchaeota archaeon]|nr:hypothetical protein [Candidatus Woesearchaeota archaeon]